VTLRPSCPPPDTRQGPTTSLGCVGRDGYKVVEMKKAGGHDAWAEKKAPRRGEQGTTWVL